MKHLITICECQDPHHMMGFYYDLDDPPELYVETQLNQSLSWWKRVDAAIRYIFGKCSRYGFGHWSEGSIGPESARELRAALDEFIGRRHEEAIM